MHSTPTRPARDLRPEAITSADADAFYVGFLAACVSATALLYYASHGQLLLYGDATAHIHIARRVFDSRTPGLSQLGTVWLPLPHLLMLPFLLSNWMWRTGIGGAIPSMVAYVAGTLGVFRLVRDGLPRTGAASVAAWCAALAYAANPNLIYLQATAMTEPLYLALFVWATVFFADFVRATRAAGSDAQAQRSRALNRCGIALGLCMLTRYDGWFAAVAFAVATFAVLWTWTAGRIPLWRSPLRPAFTRFLLILAVAPLLWFVYNLAYWGNPLEFANGPYSARAIAARTREIWAPRHPGWHAPRTAALYYMKAARLNMAGSVPHPEGRDDRPRPPKLRLQSLWFPLALAGTVLLLIFARGLWPWLLLWLPLPFYVLSIAWGDVPIFLPVWWPYSYYNVRYGLQLLPAFALFSAAVVYVVITRIRITAVAVSAVLALAAFIAASYVAVWKATPICLREPLANSAHRLAFDRQLARQFERLPAGSSVLMYSAYHAAALEFAGFPLRRTINESDNKLWRAALAAPARAADFVVAFDTPGDPVNRAVRERGGDLQTLVVIQGAGEAKATIYRHR